MILQLYSNCVQFLDAEEKSWATEAAEVELWWKSSDRFKLTKRPYSAMDVVRLRDSLPKQYPSGVQARKVQTKTVACYGFTEINFIKYFSLEIVVDPS